MVKEIYLNEVYILPLSYGLYSILFETGYIIFSLLLSSIVARTPSGRLLQTAFSFINLVIGLVFISVCITPRDSHVTQNSNSVYQLDGHGLSKQSDWLVDIQSSLSPDIFVIGLFLSLLSVVRVYRSRHVLLYDISGMAVQDFIYAILLLVNCLLVIFLIFI